MAVKFDVARLAYSPHEMNPDSNRQHDLKFIFALSLETGSISYKL